LSSYQLRDCLTNSWFLSRAVIICNHSTHVCLKHLFYLCCSKMAFFWLCTSTPFNLAFSYGLASILVRVNLAVYDFWSLGQHKWWDLVCSLLKLGLVIYKNTVLKISENTNLFLYFHFNATVPKKTLPFWNFWFSNCWFQLLMNQLISYPVLSVNSCSCTIHLYSEFITCFMDLQQIF